MDKVALTGIISFVLLLLSPNFLNGNEPHILKNYNNKNEVTILTRASPDLLNPIISSSADATYIEGNIFSAILSYNPQTLEIVPIMAKSRPKITEIEEGEFAGGMALEWELRPECTWPNGTPVTGHDLVFTMKAVKNPLIPAEIIRPYLNFVRHIEVDKDNPRKFIVYSNDRYILAESFIGTFPIYPEYAYDPEGLMRSVSIKMLNDTTQTEILKENIQLQKFANVFNEPSTSMDTTKVIGCGPYELEKWNEDINLILRKKKDWWGHKVKDSPHLQANPDKIIYKFAYDKEEIKSLIQLGMVDVVSDILPYTFTELSASYFASQEFNFYTPPAPSYYYLGLNRRNPKLRDVRVRKALAHLLDICNTIMNGFASPINSPIHSSKIYHNKSIPIIPFNPKKAKTLLRKAGWKDTDDNGIVDKIIDGEKVQLELEYKYNSGNSIREQIGLHLQKTAQLAGVKINIKVQEWTMFLHEIKIRDYEISSLAWVQGAGLDDPYQIWHTSSSKGEGSNRVDFGNEESDKLIEEIRSTFDDKKRNELYMKFQEIVAEDQPYIFMFQPKERIAIHKRFENAEPSPIRPGYFETYFKLKKDE